MHVCIVTTFFYPLLNGVSVRVLKDARALKESGHAVSIVSPHRGTEEFDCYQVGRPPVYLNTGVGKIMKTIHAKLPIDVVISHSYIADLFSYRIARRLGCKFIQQIHGPEAEEISKTSHGIKKLIGLFGCYLDSFITRRSDRIIAVEDELAIWLNEKYRFASNKIVTVANYPDLDLFQPGHKINHKFTVGYVGTLQPGRVIPLCEASAHRSDINFVVVGTGAGTSEIEKYPRVMLRSELNYGKVPDVISQFDIGVILSLIPTGMRHKGPPMKLFEYLACGKPVIAINLPELEPLVAKHRIGIITTENNIVSTIVEIKNNYNYYSSNVKKFRELMVARYNWKLEKQKLLDLIADGD